MGIDIREGGNGDCINCGLCVDACASIMDTVGRPRGLISYDTLCQLGGARRGSAHALDRHPSADGGLRPDHTGRRGNDVSGTLLLRPRLDISVERDRAPLFVELSDGAIRNGYTVKISNMTRNTRELRLERRPVVPEAVRARGRA